MKLRIRHDGGRASSFLEIMHDCSITIPGGDGELRRAGVIGVP